MNNTAQTTTLHITPERPWLAPLAGYTNLPFRLLCREFGAEVVCSEMVSAKGLYYNSPGTSALLETSCQDQPMVLQLFGCDTGIMQKAMTPLVEQGYRLFDLNMGCSVKKVVKTGCGAAMLKDVDNALRVAETMVATAAKGSCPDGTTGKVGFKFRLGWEAGDEAFLRLAKGLENAGAAWVTLHPRFAKQGFSGDARWTALAELVQEVSIPVIASGDLFTPQDGVRCVQETGVHSVMFARGALNNPAIFSEYRDALHGKHSTSPDPEKTLKIIKRHIELVRAYSTERTALFTMRSFVPRYVKEFSGARALRNQLTTCTSWEQLDAILDSFFVRWRDIKEAPHNQCDCMEGSTEI